MTNYNIRAAKDSDKWMVLEWRNHPDVRAVMLTDHIISSSEHEKWWQNSLINDDRCILILEKNSVPVGVILFNRINQLEKTAWWGFYLDNNSLSQQQKTEAWMQAEKMAINYATDELRLYEMYGDVVYENKAVWLLHKKFGFVECDAPETAVETNKKIRYIKYVCEENKPDLRPSLYVFASHNTDFLVDSLKKKTSSYQQFPYKIQKTEFGRYQVDLLAEVNSEIRSKNSCYLFIERIEDLFSDIYTLPTEEGFIKSEERVAEYLSFIKQIALRGNRVYVSDFSIQKSFPHTIEEQLTNSRIHSLINEWNESIYALKKENLIEVIPYSQVIHRVGQSFSNKYWYLARAPFSVQCLESYSEIIVGCIFASHALSARVLVLDLDNTLWKGVIGDDGIDGIVLGGDYPGNLYKELQSLFLTLKERGILLTICSKNTEEIAVEAIENHQEMRLRKKDFVSYRINWLPKSQNIKDLAAELNLGVQSLCFIDDNPVEREEVRRNVPGVYVPELPKDPSEWYQYISQLPELTLLGINESDKRRADLYKKRVDIKKAESNFTDRNDFLSSLEMDICIDELNSFNFERTHQLFNKTNQFNTTTIRYTKEQLNSWMEASSKVKVLHVRSKDKYSNEHEGVAALVLFEKDNNWVIDNFVMSCRVMGRDIEDAIISKILISAKSNNIKQVIGRFVQSEKNMPVESLYKNNKFKENSSNWYFDLTSQSLPEEPKILTLHWNIKG